ncbi:MAG TPA: hypothetical protein DD420_34155, partial [Streptomyces sp.]|nr:hypothetical protein [Streptomyces sp.]
DDLPEEIETVPAEPVAGEGRRARRLRAAAQAEAAGAEAGPEAPEQAGAPYGQEGDAVPAGQ